MLQLRALRFNGTPVEHIKGAETGRGGQPRWYVKAVPQQESSLAASSGWADRDEMD